MTAATAEQLARPDLRCIVLGVQGILNSLIGETPELDSEQPVEDVMTCNGVIASISLVGDVDWALMIHLSETTAPALAERFTGFPIPFESDDMGDAIGELANLIAGEVKVELDHVGIKANISLPQVFRGEGIEVLSLGLHDPLLLVFTTSCGPLSISVASKS